MALWLAWHAGPLVVAYEQPIHLTLTMFLAETAGFAELDAFDIAKFDQAIDDDPATDPLPTISDPGVTRRRLYHFVDRKRAEELRLRAMTCVPAGTRFRRLGNYLHALEDLFSHRNYGAGVGHLFTWHAADKPWHDPGAVVQMAVGKFDALIAYGEACGGKSAAEVQRVRNAFSNVKTLLEAWAQQEYALGTVSDDQGPERWADLTKRLYGTHLTAYTARWEPMYSQWAATQAQNSWKD